MKIEQGLKFTNPTKKRWNYQISEIDDDIVVVSWIESGSIHSTLYEMKEVQAYFKAGTWVAVDSSISVIHPKKAVG